MENNLITVWSWFKPPSRIRISLGLLVLPCRFKEWLWAGILLTQTSLPCPLSPVIGSRLLSPTLWLVEAYPSNMLLSWWRYSRKQYKFRMLGHPRREFKRVWSHSPRPSENFNDWISAILFMQSIRKTSEIISNRPICSAISHLSFGFAICSSIWTLISKYTLNYSSSVDYFAVPRLQPTIILRFSSSSAFRAVRVNSAGFIHRHCLL